MGRVRFRGRAVHTPTARVRALELRPHRPRGANETRRLAVHTPTPKAGSARTSWRPAVKRAVDVVIAVILLVVMLVPLLLIALAIKFDSRGPVLYRVTRVGHRGLPLLMLKFRKMHHNAVGTPLTAAGDPRLTRFGRVLARSRLDELPQLWDVLRGRMSIVGPRPEDPIFVALNAEAYEHILKIRPGITGLSQLAFVQEHKILDETDLVADYVHRILPQKIGLDTLYADTYRLRMDLAVLGWTVAATLLRRPVAVNRASGKMNVRRRPTLASLEDKQPRADAIADAV
jgi:lipopolysaccharide/colanic/teichoic acid biosynthesis glycosyltransferase